MLDEVLPLIGVVFVAGPPVVCLAAPWSLLTLMLQRPFAVLVAFTAVVLVATVLLCTVAAIFAMPYLPSAGASQAALLRCRVPRRAAGPDQFAASRRMIARASLRGHEASPGSTRAAPLASRVGDVSAADAASFEAVRPRLFGIAHRVLGSVAEADDVVQDAWMRWHQTDRRKVRNPGHVSRHGHHATLAECRPIRPAHATRRTSAQEFRTRSTPKPIPRSLWSETTRLSSR